MVLARCCSTDEDAPTPIKGFTAAHLDRCSRFFLIMALTYLDSSFIVEQSSTVAQYGKVKTVRVWKSHKKTVCRDRASCSDAV